MDWVVMEHSLDTEAGAYRLVVGAFEDVQVVATGTDDGTSAPLEVARVQVAQEDYLFASDDERWEGRELEDIAEEQRKLVREAIAEREAATKKRRRGKGARAMPGVGEAL